jgi:hypothetical protein
VDPHSEGCELHLEINEYRGIVEGAVFDYLSFPTFFSALVEVVMGRIAARKEQPGIAEQASEDEIYRICTLEARRLVSATELRFVYKSRGSIAAASKGKLNL